ncbi:MAG: selenide, water dikinase SelD [Saprospiraceae bacterium]|nr:selenide, water dikinase SelD [Saprospiraceae bacterium]
MIEEIKLTQYSHGAGCGCKISPKVLDAILKHQSNGVKFPNLLVGNDERDDAAVLDIGNETGVVSTTDFFMPIVDDAYDFGRIASVNAISDIYAMGAKPILAIAILGWPIDKIPAEVANKVIEGARHICLSAGIPLAGGHSIDSPEPIFGLAVTGLVQLSNLKKNGGAKVGDRLFLTKPLGVGIYTTAQKKGLLKAEHSKIAADSMLQLNSIGGLFGTLEYIHAMTDVTGFGLMGHLIEMCEASNLSATIDFDKVPLLQSEVLKSYLEQKCIPGGTLRNIDSYGHKIDVDDEKKKLIVCDPQTSGGLLVAVDENHVEEFLAITKKNNLYLESFGVFTKPVNFVVNIN